MTMLLTVLFCLIVTLSASGVPLYGEENPDKIEDQYIVIYHQNITTHLMQQHLNILKKTKSKLLFTYNIGSFKGFASRMSPRVLSGLLDDPLVKEIHYDGLERIIENSCENTQPNAPSWGLARVSHKGGISGGLNDDYYYSSYTGKGVYAYVIDTGIFIEHDDFGGRAQYGENFVDNVQTDENGHGSHCAGTIGGTSYGIAKDVTLIAVKVLGKSGSGATSGVLAGINWVTQQHKENGGPSVASMSLGSSSDGGKNAAITASVAAGVVYSVAAGNSNSDACYFYPASCPAAITVGATQLGTSDTRSSFSNYGSCVDLFAPGSSITSCGISSRTASAVLSGTSMACPHVSGAVAVILSQMPSASPELVTSIILGDAQNGYIGNVGPNSPNKLLYNKCDEN